MPYQESPYFKTPSLSAKLWKYMSIDKFTSMMHQGSLYFPNIHLFKDDYEGALTEISKKEVYRTNLLEQNTPIKQDEEFQKDRKLMEKHRESNQKYHILQIFHSFQTLLNDFSNHFMFCSGQSSQAELCPKYNLSGVQLSRWKRQLLENAASIFELVYKQTNASQEWIAQLGQLVGRLTWALDSQKSLNFAELTQVEKREIVETMRTDYSVRQICETFGFNHSNLLGCPWEESYVERLIRTFKDEKTS